MKKPFRFIFYIIVAIIIAATLSVLITILLSSFWSWFEASTGIESIGHSGPANWCYLVTFLILVSLITVAFLKYKKHKETN